MAKVTGLQLRAALRTARSKREVYEKRFPESVWTFEPVNSSIMDPKDPAPVAISKILQTLDEQIAALEVAQQLYNLQVKVPYEGTEYSLALAVKLVGTAGRLSKLWKTIAVGNVRDRYDRNSIPTRQADVTTAQKTVKDDDALAYSLAADKRSAALKYVIAFGNTIEVDLPNLDLALLGA